MKVLSRSKLPVSVGCRRNSALVLTGVDGPALVGTTGYSPEIFEDCLCFGFALGSLCISADCRGAFFSVDGPKVSSDDVELGLLSCSFIGRNIVSREDSPVSRPWVSSIGRIKSIRDAV